MVKIFNMVNDVEANLWEVAVIHQDKLYELTLQFDGYQLQSTTIKYPNGEEAVYTSVFKMPSKFRQVVMDVIHRDTIEKTKVLEERDE